MDDLDTFAVDNRYPLKKFCIGTSTALKLQFPHNTGPFQVFLFLFHEFCQFQDFF